MKFTIGISCIGNLDCLLDSRIWTSQLVQPVGVAVHNRFAAIPLTLSEKREEMLKKILTFILLMNV